MKYLIERDEKNRHVMSYLLDEGGRAVEIHADSLQETLAVGDILIGRVERVLENIHACFVQLSPDVKGYLPFEEIVEPVFTKNGPAGRDPAALIRQSDEVVVQVTREAYGSKEASLSTRLQLKGTYAVLRRGSRGIGVSRKIPEPRRTYLKTELVSEHEFDELQQAAGPCGVTVRTNAGPALDGAIKGELSALSDGLGHILLTAPYRSAFSVLYRGPEKWLRRLDSLPQEHTEAVITDDQELLARMTAYLKPAGAGTASPERNSGRADELHIYGENRDRGPSEMDQSGPGWLYSRLRFYRDPQISMHALFSLTRELSQALSRKVNMNSGANLVIEQTEALSVIDVNSAHFIKGREKEEAVLKVNLEAAKECCRQIRLRNLSGMILIDFINMQEEESYGRLMQALRTHAVQDPVHMQVVDRTGLGLIELTRRREEVPLSAQIYC